jgi:hypothetical protein
MATAAFHPFILLYFTNFGVDDRLPFGSAVE